MEAGQFEVQNMRGTIYEADLDLNRTKRIYSTLNKLSEEAIGFLNGGNLKEFSFAADRMRPMMSYINDNSILISKHLEGKEDQDTNHDALSDEIRAFSSSLIKNLRIVENAQKTMDQITFSTAFFLSDELTNAYLDNQIPLSWEFQHDLVIALNLDNKRLIELLHERGQKRIFLINGSLNIDQIVDNSFSPDTVLYRVKDYQNLLTDLTLFNDRPPRRVVVLDVGEKSTSKEIMDDMRDVINRGRQAGWLRFNTINRGDSVKILDNLYNITEHRQTSDFHQKFKDMSAVIVCPGPSLSKNVHLLKEVKGRILIICVLHAYKALKRAGVEPDMVIHTDPQSLKNLYFEKEGQQISQWQEWVEDNDFSDLPYFITSSSAAPEMFNINTNKIVWMSPGMQIGNYVPIDLFDYSRVGGSVSHSAFDLVIEFGFKSIALMGQDLAFADDGELYNENAQLDKSKKRMEGYGETFMVEGSEGKEVKTNNSFSFFAKSYTRFAEELKGSGINLFNCTEGGMFIEGFEHCKFQQFIDQDQAASCKDNVNDIFARVEGAEGQVKEVKKKIRQYISKNMILTNQISELIKAASKIGQKENHSDHELARFDALQNKAIKKMKTNPFFELGLQREMYMLRSGLLADRSVKGQIGFHLDFLRAAKRFNNKCRRALSTQLDLMSRH